MNTLVIKDLSLTADLDHTAMNCIHGGFFMTGAFVAHFVLGASTPPKQEEEDLDALLPLPE